MKSKFQKLTYPFLILSVFFMCSGFYNLKKGGCDNSELIREAIDQLKKYTLVQDFPFYMKKKKKEEIEYKKQIIMLNRGVRYKFFTVRNPNYEGLPILSIYNNEKQEFLLGTTYNATFKKFYTELEFECRTTGNYCMSLSFQDGREGCALGIFAALIKE